ncbi:polyribonucleotide nucleotidyltransferase [Candidatus Peregrinibacteria bacterium CG11_big_fil_rev_8_21_14_0_20_41_10]|nr:MAG: polyribonucleotide nucleotidyltransferase [Candidatus Peregrinibacteria bacterium CG11_big_fil_rev_8_21_14_0_20_41_10]PIZ73052.1 MAG: polyribonucleotide nucleotidyltransferase [Candidatus Peregrinibacteria bacterium CG_4_10_14_0_2_um_filter_41_8]PJC38075.1 MAG: polyribonucleotide nucleotidyltransferase [Candidatus Peregrinibacteria bacterium CG_4_9_14_0_2_um_filter_41_14]
MSIYQKPVHSVEMDLAGRKLTLTTGHYALQASGAVTASLGDTVVLCTGMMSSKPREGTDFFPLMVDYEEKYYATGKISGSRFIKREGRPSEEAVLNSRLIDRPIRPLFPKGFRNDVQVICTVLSADMEVHPGTTAMIGASAALQVAGMPMEAPISGIRIGMIDGEFIVNPTYEQAESGDLNLVVAGTEDAIMMVEAEAKEVTDEKMLEALELAHTYIKQICQLQKELIAKVNPTPLPYEITAKDDSAIEMVRGVVSDDELDAVKGELKKDYKDRLHELEDKVLEKFAAQIEAEEVSAGAIKEAVSTIVEKRTRDNILTKGIRLDGRKTDEVRPIFVEVGVLPRTHGSGLFQRGETQVLNICTLGGPGAAQIVDTMDQDVTRRYMHHYNFPGYSVGEVKPMRSPGRREIGHGYLAEKALLAVLPDPKDFPYTMRLVSEVLSCNGSSSMGSVCGSTLSLMDAGVPLKAPVSGIAMGLVTNDDGSQYKILTDIQGMEDFGGDMDLKVAGTVNGITALQMDIKLKGLKMELLREAIGQANKGRDDILNSMLAVIAEPRTALSPFAPVIESMMIDPDKIREVIGKGGETIQAIVKESGAEIDITQDGQVNITAPNREAANVAMDMIKGIVVDPEPGTDYEATVMKVMEFGVFVEFLPGKQGLVHVSKLSKEFMKDVADKYKVGDKLKVRLEGIDDKGRYNLSALPFLA